MSEHGLVKFDFEGRIVRTAGTAEEPLFCASDVCEALGFANPWKAVADHVDEGDLTKREAPTTSGIQQMNFVNESGLYALIFGSRLDTAKRFKRWVTHEVLPALRKTGRYEKAAKQSPANETKLLTAKRLADKERRLNGEFLLRTLKTINEATPLDPGVFAATAAAAAETVLGRELPALKPKTDTEWFTPTQIAERLHVTANRVGLVISELGIRGNIDGVARAVLNKAKHAEKTVTTYQYTEKAIAVIAAKLDGAIPEEAA